MQDKKIYQEKLFNNFQLSDRIPKQNFYRRLLGVLDLDYLHELTKGIKQAIKVMHMAAIAYNLKKYLKFITKTAKSGTRSLVAIIFIIKSLYKHCIFIVSGVYFRVI